MAVPSSISQVTQLGVEATAGTAVAATKRLQSISVKPGVKTKQNTFRPEGQKYPSLVTLGKEWTESSLDGVPTYDELLYVLAGVFCVPTTTELMDDVTSTGGYQHVFSPSNTAADTIKTYTIEKGNATLARRSAYNLVNEFGLKWSREEVTIDGALLSQAIEDDHDLTSSGVDTLPLVPMEAGQIDVYLDTTSAGLGTTQLTHAYSGEFSIKDRFGPSWTLNSSLTSFAEHVETEPSVGLTLLLAADAQGMGLLANMRAGDTRFVRVQWTGPQIYDMTSGDDIVYLFQLDMAVRVLEPKPWDDEDGVYAIEWPFQIVADADWGHAYQATLVNKTEDVS